MGKAKESTVTVKLPASLVEQISELNEVDPKHVERTIARILRDEIAVEKKLRDLESPEDAEQNEAPRLQDSGYRGVREPDASP